MSQTARNRLIKGFAAQRFAQAVSLIIQVGSIPLLLHFWGSFLYGEWIILSTVPSYFALSDLGSADTASTEMTMRIARGDRVGSDSGSGSPLMLSQRRAIISICE